MRNLKINVLLILLLSVFACDTQQVSEDEIPEIINIRSRPGLDPGPSAPIKRPSLTIAVQYPDHYDKVQFRANNGAAFGLIVVQECISDPNRELWIVNDMTPIELLALVESIFPYVDPPSSNSNGDGGVEGYATEPYSGQTAIEIPVTFYYNGVCF